MTSGIHSNRFFSSLSHGLVNGVKWVGEQLGKVDWKKVGVVAVVAAATVVAELFGGPLAAALVGTAGGILCDRMRGHASGSVDLAKAGPAEKTPSPRILALQAG